MKKLLLVGIAAAGLGMGVFGMDPASACKGEGDVDVVALPDTGTGVSASVFTDADSPAGHTAEANTGQGVSYCSQGTIEGINDLLP